MRIGLVLLLVFLAAPSFAKRVDPCRAMWTAEADELVSPANGLPYTPLNIPAKSPRVDSIELRERIQNDILDPVLTEGRAAGVWHEIENLGRNGLRIRTKDGRYDIVIDRGTHFDELGEVVPPIRYEGKKVTGRVYLHPDWLTPENMKNPLHVYRLRGLVRSMFRADEIHPHMKSRTEEEAFAYQPSDMQNFTLEQLIETFRNAKNKQLAAGTQKPNVAGLIAPPGYGKTILALLLGTHFFGGNYRKPESAHIPEDAGLLVTVENIDILDSWYEKAKNYFHLQPDEIAVMYESNLDGVRRSKITPKTKLVLSTRTGTYNNLDGVTDFLRSKPRHLAIVDEAHNAGLVADPNEPGHATAQYQAILARWRHSLGKHGSDSNVLFLSATMWHQSSEMITDPNLIDGNLVAPFLTKQELDEVSRGLYIEKNSVAAMMRAMYSGYSSPWMKTTTAQVIDNKTGEEKLFIKEKKAGKVVGETLDREVLRSIARDIVNARRLGEPRDRGLIFVRGTARANLVARELQIEVNNIERELGYNQSTKIQPYHSGEGSIEDGVGFLKSSEADEGRFLVVDRKFGEGVDAPPINRIVMLRPVDLADVHQVRSVVQAVTRAIRVSIGKINFKVIDYSGKMDQLLQLPDKIHTQRAPKKGGGDGGEGGPKPPFKIEELDRSETSVHTETVVPTQTSPQEALVTIQSMVNGKTSAQVAQATAPFSHSPLSHALIELANQLDGLHGHPVAEAAVIKLPWGRKLLEKRDSIQHALGEIRDTVPELMDGTAQAGAVTRESDLETLTQDLQGQIGTLNGLWAGILEDVAETDPYRNASAILQITAGGSGGAAKDRRKEIGQWLAQTMKALVASHGAFDGYEVVHDHDQAGQDRYYIEIRGPGAFAALANESGGRINLSRPDGRVGSGGSRGEEYGQVTVRAARDANTFTATSEHPWTSSHLGLGDLRLDKVKGTAYVGGSDGAFPIAADEAGQTPIFRDSQGYNALATRLDRNREWYLERFITTEILPTIRRIRRNNP